MSKLSCSKCFLSQTLCTDKYTEFCQFENGIWFYASNNIVLCICIFIFRFLYWRQKTATWVFVDTLCKFVQRSIINNLTPFWLNGRFLMRQETSCCQNCQIRTGSRVNRKSIWWPAGVKQEISRVAIWPRILTLCEWDSIEELMASRMKCYLLIKYPILRFHFDFL